MARLLPTAASKWMAQGIAESEACRSRWVAVKGHIMNAGMAFMKAREAVKDGDFSLFLQSYETHIHRVTVYRYIGFVEEALGWAAAEKPALQSNPNALFEHAKAMVILSPKGFVALMRQLGEMRKFGEYDSVKYQTRKLLKDEVQLELEFGKLVASIDMFGSIDTALLELPDGKTESEALTEIETGLESALTKVRMRMARGEEFPIL